MPKKSAETVLTYVGPRRFANLPARDLDQHDIARFAYRRLLSEQGAAGKRPDPRNLDPEVIEKAKAELTGSGIWKES